MEDETKTEEVSLEDRVNELSKKFEDFTAKFAKKFEDEEKETELEVSATDAKDDPAPLNPPSEEDETKKIELAAKRGAEEAIKQFTAKFGTTALGKAGSPSAPQKEKHFEEHVTDIALKEFSGDTTKARAAVLSNKAKYGDAWKAYEASRLVKHS